MKYHYDHYESLSINREEMSGVLDAHGYRIRIHIPERKFFSAARTQFWEASRIAKKLGVKSSKH